MRFHYLGLLVLFLFIQPQAYAACTNPEGVPGELMYNDTHDVFQGCTTRGWMGFHAPPPAPSGQQGCPNIGDVCASGMIYAGDFNGNKLYAAADDAPTVLKGGLSNPSASGMGFCATSPYTGGSCDTGKENTQILKDHASTFPAAEYCASLNAHGQSAGWWYLPSRNELNVIYQNLKTGKPAGTLNFQNANYWSSTEQSAYFMWRQGFADGTINGGSRSGSLQVRCVGR